MISQPLPMVSTNQMIPVGSPRYVQTVTIPNQFNQARLKLWVWQGQISTATNTDPNYTLIKDKVSIDDLNVIFEISEFIKPFIKPVFTKSGSYLSESVWFYYELEYVNVQGGVPSVIRTDQSLLYWATLGWNWNYEDQAPISGQNLADGTVDDRFNINNITSKPLYSFVQGVTYFNTVLSNLGSDNNHFVVTRPPYIPSEFDCNKEPFVITYINKSGLFDQLTTLGKVEVSNEYSKDIYRVTRRNPMNYINRQDHIQKINNIESVETYKINTGRLDPILSNKIEEIYSSPLVYITDVNKGVVKTVIVDSGTVVRKTQINDKSRINYIISFKETSNKIRSTV